MFEGGKIDIVMSSQLENAFKELHVHVSTMPIPSIEDAEGHAEMDIL